MPAFLEISPYWSLDWLPASPASFSLRSAVWSSQMPLWCSSSALHPHLPKHPHNPLDIASILSYLSLEPFVSSPVRFSQKWWCCPAGPWTEQNTMWMSQSPNNTDSMAGERQDRKTGRSRMTTTKKIKREMEDAHSKEISISHSLSTDICLFRDRQIDRSPDPSLSISFIKKECLEPNARH